MLKKSLSEQSLKAIQRKGNSEIVSNNLNSSYINLDKVIPDHQTLISELNFESQINLYEEAVEVVD